MIIKHLLALCLTATLALAALPPVSSGNALERRSEHPYLLYTDVNIARLKERVAREPVIAEAWRRILAEADSTLANQVPPASGNPRARRGNRNRSNDALLLAYRMTGERKYAERVRDTLMRQMQTRGPIGGGVANGGELMQRDPPWNAGLNSGAGPQAFGVAFDTIHDMLTPDERRTLAHNLAQRLGARRAAHPFVGYDGPQLVVHRRLRGRSRGHGHPR